MTSQTLSTVRSKNSSPDFSRKKPVHGDCAIRSNAEYHEANRKYPPTGSNVRWSMIHPTGEFETEKSAQRNSPIAAQNTFHRQGKLLMTVPYKNAPTIKPNANNGPEEMDRMAPNRHTLKYSKRRQPVSQCKNIAAQTVPNAPNRIGWSNVD